VRSSPRPSAALFTPIALSFASIAFVFAVAFVFTAHALAQTPNTGSCTFTDETGKTVTWPNCVDPAEKPQPPRPAAPAKTGNAFPFPGESTPDANTPAPAAKAAAPAKPANAFPFPGEPDTTPAGKPDGAPGLKDAGSSGTSSDQGSSSSSSSSSSSDPAGPLEGDDDPAARAAAARRAARKKLPAVPRQSPSEQEDEDLKVAAFYQNDGNFKAAYARATDAVSLAADDPDAHFALAEAARRLGKLDEAEAHYKKCLDLDPLPKEKKAAEKALKEMSGGAQTSLF
jgi:hypothetical protein